VVESLLANIGTIEIDNVATWRSLDEVDGSRGSLFGERKTFSLPPDIKLAVTKLCPENIGRSVYSQYRVQDNRQKFTIGISLTREAHGKE
jgi:hypothetical protein